MRFGSVLSSEEERLLYDLIEATNKDGDLNKWFDEKDILNNPKIENICMGLGELGYLDAGIDENGHFYIDELTSPGRCYFIDKHTREQKELEERKKARNHDYKVAALSALIGGAFGLFSGIFATVILVSFGIIG